MQWGKPQDEDSKQVFKPLNTPGEDNPNPQDYTGQAEVNVLEEQPDSEAITVNEDALVQFDVQTAALAELASFKKIKVDVNVKATVNTAKDAKKRTRDLRLKIQRRQKELNADLNKQKNRIKGNATALIVPIKETEEYLAGELKKYADHLEKLKEEERKKEAARLAILKQNMETLEKTCGAGLVSGMTAEQIREKLNVLENTQIPTEVFQENYQIACDLLNHAIENTRIALEKRRKHEEEQAALKIQQDINELNAWFNKVFGWNSTAEKMEAGLKKLEAKIPPDHLADLVKTLIEQGGQALEMARTREAEQEKLRKERIEGELTHLERELSQMDTSSADILGEYISFWEGFKLDESIYQEKMSEARKLVAVSLVSAKETLAAFPKEQEPETKSPEPEAAQAEPADDVPVAEDGEPDDGSQDEAAQETEKQTGSLIPEDAEPEEESVTVSTPDADLTFKPSKPISTITDVGEFHEHADAIISFLDGLAEIMDKHHASKREWSPKDVRYAAGILRQISNRITPEIELDAIEAATS